MLNVRFALFFTNITISVKIKFPYNTLTDLRIKVTVTTVKTSTDYVHLLQIPSLLDSHEDRKLGSCTRQHQTVKLKNIP